MELSINNNLQPLRFRFENTKHKLGVRIWGDRRSFHELHELLGECWDCENADMSRAEGCSYIGINQLKSSTKGIWQFVSYLFWPQLHHRAH